MCEHHLSESACAEYTRQLEWREHQARIASMRAASHVDRCGWTAQEAPATVQQREQDTADQLAALVADLSLSGVLGVLADMHSADPVVTRALAVWSRVMQDRGL